MDGKSKKLDLLDKDTHDEWYKLQQALSCTIEPLPLPSFDTEVRLAAQACKPWLLRHCRYVSEDQINIHVYTSCLTIAYTICARAHPLLRAAQKHRARGRTTAGRNSRVHYYSK